MNEESKEPTAASKFFDEAFGNYQRELHGSEAEIVVMKRVALHWYKVGRLSMLDEAKRYHIRAVRELEEKHFNNLPLDIELPKPYYA